MKVVNFNQGVSAIKAFGAKRTLVFQGENGIGKTALFHHVARDPFFANHIAVKPIDCTQLSDGSIWMPDIDRELGVSRELPNERLGVSKTNQKGINGSRPVIIFLDEIAKARQYIKDVLAPIVYERRVGNYELPEGSVVFCATNLDCEGLGDNIQAHLRSRLTFYQLRKPTQAEWKTWAINVGIAPEVIACTEEHPQWFDSFLDYEPNGKFYGRSLEKDNPHIFNPRGSQESYVNPRSLHAVSDLVYERELVDNETFLGGMAGTIGEPAAELLNSFIKFGDETPAYQEIVNSPASCRIPSNPVAQIITTLKCVTQTNTRDEAEAVSEYIMRMRKEMQSMFCNNVANSTRAGTFITVNNFKKMIGDNAIFFATK